MARRSPLNKRYQKDANVGSTRKSAAAAKPKRSSASSAASSSSAKTSSSTRSRAGAQRFELSPELKKLQKISFGMLGVAVVISLLYLWQAKNLGGYGSLMLGFAYALMFGALYIDFVKIRPAIKAGQKGQSAQASSAKAQAKSGTSGKSGTSPAEKKTATDSAENAANESADSSTS